MREQVFIDTVGLIGLQASDDAHHAEATRLYSELIVKNTRSLLSDFVLGEFLAACARGPIRAQAITTVEQLRRSRHFTVVESSRTLWDRAFDLYRSRPDKEWSLVDCSSMVLCQDQDVHRIFTADRHFAQAGLEPLLR